MIDRFISLVTRITRRIHPAKALLLGYAFYLILGWGFLSLPVARVGEISVLDNLFTAAASISTAGFGTVDVGSSYTFFGQLVVLILIQLGGIGYATLGSVIFISMAWGDRGLHEKVTKAYFPLPRGFDMRVFLKSVLLYTLVCEGVGAIWLSYFFAEHGVINAAWEGIFHSISAFSTAGLSLFANNLQDYQTDVWFNLIISLLCILGGMGFIVVVDLYHRVKGERDHLSFTTKIILSVTAWFLALGTLFVFFSADLPGLSVWDRLLAAFFQTMSAATTAGFNTVNIDAISSSGMVLLLFLMTFGASPSGTGGGLKSTTFAALVGHLLSTLRGQKETTFWHHEIRPQRLLMATSSFIAYLFILTAALFFLTLFETHSFYSLLVEAAAALTTTGFSTGITPHLTSAGKFLVILLMFIGRVGILTFGLAITAQTRTRTKRKSDIVL